jgi:hypothetical protein
VVVVPCIDLGGGCVPVKIGRADAPPPPSPMPASAREEVDHKRDGFTKRRRFQ